MTTRTTRTALALSAAAGLAVITLAACSSSGGQPPVATPSDGASQSANATGGTGQATQAPVALTKTGTFGNGVTVKVTSISRVKLAAEGPGEVAGPGIRVNLAITNSSGADVSLDAAAVNLFYGAAKTPASPAVSTDKSFSGTLANGSTATGTYSFSVPANANPILLQVSYTPTEPVVVFAGKVS